MREAGSMAEFFRHHAAKFGTGALVALFYVMSLPESFPADQISELVSRFRFETATLAPADNGKAFQQIRKVHPALARIDAWISSVGAAVAMAASDIATSPAMLPEPSARQNIQ